jgi:hypothetical protein
MILSDQLIPSSKDLPKAIWMPVFESGQLPCCYQGSPLEMVQQMAKEMNPALSVHETIDYSVRFLADNRKIGIGIPKNLSEEVRSTCFIHALIALKVATVMPSA